MTNYTPADNWATAQIPDLTDLVKGGTGTGANSSDLQKQLADRTQFLYNRLGGYFDVADVTGTGTINNTFSNKLISVVATANVTLTLDPLTNFKKGCRIAFVAKLSGSGGPFWANIVSPANITSGSITRTNIWLYDGEMIELVRGTSEWHWTLRKGNFDKLGEVELKRFQPKNSFIGDGTSGLLRATYPRLWEVINGSLVTDANWTSDPFRYRGQFSSGNGSTTFRSADYRAMFFRALDNSRNVSLGRQDALVGGYEADDNKAHGHDIQYELNGSDGTPNAHHLYNGDSEGHGHGVNTLAVNNSGGTEARPKNVAFNPYIYY